MSTINAETAVRERYAAGAKTSEAKLCCPVEYNPEYLKVIPQEVIDRDYGCGDPSKYLRENETVLDLGSGTGKICFIAAQVVGPNGKVIGIDMTDEMLSVARSNTPIVAERIGYGNVEFRKGRIQDLALDLEKLDAELKARPITDAASFLRADELAQDLRVKHPLVATDSVDVVVSNCVLNLVEPKSKRQLFEEIFRVLKKGGRLVSTLGEPSQDKARQHGVTAVGFMAKPKSEQLTEMAQLIDAGRVKVVVDRVRHLEEAAQAQDELERDHIRGKVVLQLAEA